MKKQLKFDWKRFIFPSKKILLIMKILTLLLTVNLISISAVSYGQKEKFTFNEENVAIKQILSAIESQSKIKFLYRDEILENKFVTVNLTDANLDQVLKVILQKSGNSYRTLDNNLIVIATNETFQVHTVTGKVTDGSTGEPIIGANVVIEGTTTGVITDVDGKFALDIPNANSVLLISFIGYITETIPVNGQSNIPIALIPDITKLEEVVVVGYGTQKKTTATGAISSAKGEVLIKAPVTNVSNSLVGRFTGLVGVQRSGEPGQDGTSLLIRGQNSLGNNSPLFVIDGIAGRSIDRIDPNDIESVTILKDASAAIYGAQAANGVILITTKRGKEGKTRVSVNINQGMNQPTVLPKMTNASEYATYVNEILEYQNLPLQYTQDDIALYGNGTDPWGHPNTNFFEEVIKPWSAQNNQNVTVSGGSENMKYFVSMGHRYQDGNYKRSAVNYEQNNVRANLDGQLTKNISLSFDVAGRQENRNGASLSTTDDLWRFLLRSKPTMNAYWPNGKPGPDIEKGYNPAVITTTDAGYTRNKLFNLESNTRLNINIPWVKGLSVSGNFSIDKIDEHGKRWQKPWTLYYWDGTTIDAGGIPVLNPDIRGPETQLAEYMQNSQTITWNTLINYGFQIHNHDFKILFGHERNTYNLENVGGSRIGYSSTALEQLNVGNTSGAQNTGMAYHSARLNYFGRINYNFSQKYLLEFVWRYDGSSKFAKGHQFGFFPGVSGGWRISEEDFWKNNITSITNFKIKGSWGQTGNDRISDYQYLSSYTYNVDTRNSFITGTDTGIENLYLTESTVGNPDVTWERATQTDVGFEMQLLGNKISINADYFHNTRSDILWRQFASLPAMSGISNPPYTNLGEVEVKGIEGDITYSNRHGDFDVIVSANASYNKSRVLFMDEDPSVLDYQKATGRVIGNNPGVTGDNLYYVATGIYQDEADIANSPVNSLTTSPRPGDLKFKDVDHSGTIDAKDRVRSDKNAYPNFIAGFNVSLRYKIFDLSFLIQGATGGELLNIRKESGEAGNVYKYLCENRWTPENKGASIPRAHNGSEYFAYPNPSTFYLYSNDYIRLKNLEIGCSLPDKLVKRLRIENLRLYISGSNLLTFSEISNKLGFDPEIANNLGQAYPIVRVLNAGLTLTF